MCDHCGCRAFPPIAELTADHETILDLAWALAEARRSEDRPDRDVRRDLLALLDRHVAKEETGLYPALVATGAVSAGEVRDLEAEHRDLRRSPHRWWLRSAGLLRPCRAHRGRGDGAVPRGDAGLRRRGVGSDERRPPGRRRRYGGRGGDVTPAPSRQRGDTGAQVRERPTSRWRATATGGGRGAADRVRLSHAQARTTLRLVLVFVATAALAGAAGSARWLPLHLFLAGGVMLAISGVSLMLTVTWSAAPAPADRWAAAQRWLVAGGAAGIAVGRHAELGDGVIGVAATAYLAGLVLLGALLLVTVRRAVERRFDPAVAAYLAALAFGTAGVVLGAWMAIGSPSISMRSAHVTINVLGLVGLVVGGTLPFFASTVGRTRMAPHASARRLVLSLSWQTATLLLAVLALSADAAALAGIGLGGYALGVLAVLGSLPRPTRRQLQWAGPRLLALWAGGLWWATAVAATAVDASANRLVFGDRWLVVLVVAGYAQILWGSLAYLLPMLRGGGHERLAEGFATTRSWPGLAAANVAGLGAATGRPTTFTAVAIAAWVLDSAWRAARVGTARAARPTEEPT